MKAGVTFGFCHKPKESLILYRTAKVIRKIILEHRTKIPFPLRPEVINDENFQIPNLLYNHLACILSDLPDYVASGLVSQVNPQLCVRILSVAQDLLFVASNGGKRTPKHVSLPMRIKHLTGLAELITVLNRLGYGMSYTKVEEEKTGMAERQIRSQQNGELIPSSSYHGVFLQFSWDNNDLEECTPSGSGTTHCTNGIVIQKIPCG